MFWQVYGLLQKLRYVFFALFSVGGLFLILVLLAAIGTATSNNAQSARYNTGGGYYGPNAVTSALNDVVSTGNKAIVQVGNSAGQAVSATGHAAGSAAKSVASIVVKGGKLVGRCVGIGLAFVGKGVVQSLAFIGRGVVWGLTFVASIPANVLGFLSSTATASTLTRPSAGTQLPVIDPHAPVTVAAQVPLLQVKNAEPPALATNLPPVSSGGVAWPIHGRITTLFGVPHWPYQPTHTGLDISSGRRSGETQVRPYKPGRVKEVVHSGYGLGNHVIVDHGGGITSVYAHLATIAVRVGQNVNKTTVLGREGTTGMSTGTHLHFEIRLNGKPTDPRRYISGHP